MHLNEALARVWPRMALTDVRLPIRPYAAASLAPSRSSMAWSGHGIAGRSAVKDIANKGQPRPLPVMPSQNLRRLNSDVRSEELSHQMAFDSQERCAEAYEELARCEQSRHRCRGLSVGLCLRYGQSSAAPERGAGSPAGSRFATQDQTKKKAQTPAARFVHRRASRRSELWA